MSRRPSAEKFWGAKPKQAGKKEGGWGEGIFARLLPFPSPQEHGGRGGWGEFRRVLAKDRGQTRHLAIHCRTPQKNFLFLFRRKNRSRAKSEMQRKFFCGVASEASGGGAGFLSGGFAQRKFELRPKNTTKSKYPPVWVGILIWWRWRESNSRPLRCAHDLLPQYPVWWFVRG